MRPNPIRQLWANGKPALNCWISLPGTLAAEMLAHQGWDSQTVDLQHGASDFASMCAMFAAISTTEAVPLMRVAWSAQGDVMRALDCRGHRSGKGLGHALCRALGPWPGAGAGGAAEPDRSGGDGSGGSHSGRRQDRGTEGG